MLTLAITLLTAIGAVDPLPLPGNFDPEVNMPMHKTELGVFHTSRSAAGLMARLVANGTPEDLAMAKKVFKALQSCQELRKESPHYGNFRWMLEDEAVEDFNAVEFILENIIPMMIEHGDRLTPEMHAQVLDLIRLGLHAVAQLDVSVGYTNIAVFDIVNTCLGGALLNDAAIMERGRRKLLSWADTTMENGTTFEFNSPTYTRIAVQALDTLADFTQHEETRAVARTMATRIGLGVALHIHPTTGRWVGPHSRAYQPTVVCSGPPEVGLVKRWIDDGTVPAWVAHAIDPRQLPFQIEETAYATWGIGLTSYITDAYALGVATARTMDQANALMVHYNRPGAERPGVVYCRYLLNDKWFGDFYHSTDRSRSRNLSDEGQFLGVQSGPRAIGMYSSKGLLYMKSAKAVLIWTQSELVDAIWVGGRKVESLPADVAPGETVVVVSGDAMVGVRPLTITDMGINSPVRLIEAGGDLVLEMYNYKGPRKEFWEMQWPGGFYKGRPQCGFYVEVAKRTDHADGAAFTSAIDSGTFTDKADPPHTYMGETERLWTAAYQRDGETIGITVDLMEWKLRARWTQDGPLGWPMLESEHARQNADGRVVVGDAVLECGTHPAWLYAAPDAKTWAAGYVGPAQPLTLNVPGGKVALEAMGTGTVVWDNGTVTIDAIGVQGKPTITGGVLAK